MQKFILQQVADRQTSLHTHLANVCLRWCNLLIAAREWEQVAQAFADAAFIVTRNDWLGFASVYADVQAVVQAPHVPSEWQACEE